MTDTNETATVYVLRYPEGDILSVHRTMEGAEKALKNIWPDAEQGEEYAERDGWFFPYHDTQGGTKPRGWDTDAVAHIDLCGLED